MLRFFIIIILFGGIKYSCIAQLPLFFDCLTIKEGLPHNTIYTITQDQTGMMWLGAQNGLLRYDGYAFKTFTQVKNQQGDELNLRSVHALLMDKKGLLWVGTNADGLLCYDTKSGVWQQKIDIKIRINSIFEDKKGNIWVATMGQGIYLLSADNQQNIQNFYSHNAAITNDNVFEFAQGNDEKIWFVAAGQGIYYFDTIDQKIHAIHNTASPAEDLNSFRKCIYFSPDNQLWVGTESDGLYIYNIEKQFFTHYSKNKSSNQNVVSNHQISKSSNLQINSNNISDIFALPNGQIWLSSDGDGLFIYDSQNKSFSHEFYQKNNYKNLNTNNLLQIFSDKNENIWIATFNGGINIWKKNRTRFLDFQTWTKRNLALSNRSILSICESKNGSVWLGTDGGGIDVWNSKNATFKNYKYSQNNNFPSGNVVKSLLTDQKGNIWAGYYGKGLDCFAPETEKFQHFKKDVNSSNALSGENIWALAEDNLSNIWIATLDGGLNKYNIENQLFTRYLRNPNISTTIAENSIFAVLPTNDGNVWVGTQNSGLDILDEKTGTFIHFQHDAKNPTSISSNDIRCIFKDKKNQIWIGTESGGLNLWLGEGKFQHWNTQNGLLNNAIMGITEDENGYLWLSSFQGITRFESDKSLFLNYDFHSPEHSNLFNHFAIARLSDNSLCFGGINGIDILQTTQNVSNNNNTYTQITDFKIFNQSITPFDETNILQKSLTFTQEIDLDYTQSLFSFEFSALDYTAPEAIKYAYFLEGFDKNWQYTNHKERSASYNNLSHGTYTFFVKSSNADGTWSENITTIKVIIHPPFWKTIWFRGLLIIAIFSLLYWLFQLYTRRREEQLRGTMLEQEQAILRLENEKLENEVETKTSDLMSKAILMGRNNQVMLEIKELLKLLKGEPKESNANTVRQLENIVNNELQNEDNWQQLSLYFDKINRNFTKNLQSDFPNLTQNDLRLCILIKLNLSAKEMAALLNISVAGIEKGKYRLKKRLNLSIEEDLNNFLRQF